MDAVEAAALKAAELGKQGKQQEFQSVYKDNNKAQMFLK